MSSLSPYANLSGTVAKDKCDCGCETLSGSLSLQVTETVAGFDYNELENIPTINGVLLKGDMTSKDLNIDTVTVDPGNDEHIIFNLGGN